MATCSITSMIPNLLPPVANAESSSGSSTFKVASLLNAKLKKGEKALSSPEPAVIHGRVFGGDEMTSIDVSRLLDTAGLINDAIINTFRMLIKAETQDSSTLLASTFVWTDTIIKPEKWALAWAKKKSWTSYRRILVPIHWPNLGEGHWALMVVDHDKFILSYYDSIWEGARVRGDDAAEVSISKLPRSCLINSEPDSLLQ